MLFETGTLNNWIPDISDNHNESRYQFAIVDNNKKLIGYLDYCIDWYTSCASRFALMWFDKGNQIISIDILKTMRRLIRGYELHRIEFRMIGKNPVEKHYDRICKHYVGTKHILKDAVKDRYGKYHDDIIYEIINRRESEDTQTNRLK